MKNKQRIGVSLVLVTALSLLVIATAIPTSAQLTVTVSIDNITLPQRSTATIPIMITDVPVNNVSSALINLTYDPTVVQIIDVGNSDFDEFFYNPVNGKVRMIGFQTGDTLPGPIKFADVTVKAIGNPGDCTPLNLDGNVEMSTGSPYELNLDNGSVCIVAAAVPVFNTFGMIALIGLLALVLLVAVRKR